MSATLALILSFAVLAFAAGLALLRRSSLLAREQATSAFIDQRIKQSAPKVAAPEAAAASRGPRRKALPWEFFFERAGVEPSKGFYAKLIAPGVVLMLLMLVWQGPVSAIALAVIYVLGVMFRFWLKAARRHRTIVRQLPVFLDGMVRMLTVGNSLPAAFQTAASNADVPLRDVLERTARQVQAGVELDVALRQSAQENAVDEIYMFAAVVDLSTRFGGRADQILSRMAGFMRDREQAQGELRALSAETRMSAWVLALMPIFVGGVLMVANPKFFEPMLYEPDGQKLLMIGIGLQAVGGFILYKLGKSL